MKPTVPEVLPLVHALYSRNGAGCCLHNVLDDGNTETASVQWCLEYAQTAQCQECVALAEKLLLMTRTQRKKLYMTKHDHITKGHFVLPIRFVSREELKELFK